MTPTTLDPLTRFLLLHSVLLVAGLAASVLLRRKYGPSAATLIQRLTLAAIVASALLSLAPLPRLEMPVLPPVSPNASPETPLPERRRMPPVPVFISFSDTERAYPNVAVDLPSPRFVVTFITGIVYGAGLLVSLAYLALGAVRLHRIHAESLPLRNAALADEWAELTQGSGAIPPMREYSGTIPFLAGLRRPTLYLPANDELRGDALTAALAHEATHVLRRDLLWNLTARLACAFLWCQPLVWLLWRDMERTAEDACDEAALQRGIAPRQYADLLLRLSEHSHPPLTVAAGMSAFRSQTGKRIARILKGQTMPPLTIRVRGAIACSVLLLTLFAAVLSHARLRPANLEATTKTSATPAPISYKEAEKIFRTSRHRTGWDDGPVGVVLFADFACPSCRQSFNDLLKPPGIPTLYEIGLAFRHHPLTEVHPDAMRLAIAAEAAGRQMRFWPAAQELMRGPIPTEAEVPKRMEQIGLVSEWLEMFKENEKDTSVEFTVRDDMKVAERLKIESVPAFLIFVRPTKKAFLVYGANSLKQALERLRTETAQTAPSEPLITYSCKHKTVGIALAEICHQANATYTIPEGFDSRLEIALDVTTAPLHRVLEQVGRYMGRDFNISLRGDGKYVLEDKPSGIIAGRVILPPGMSAKNITVTANLTETEVTNPDARLHISPRTTIDDKGNFRITDCGPYPYRIEVMDFAHEWIGEKFPTIEAKIKEETKVPAIRLIRAGFIEGDITWDDGVPIANMQIFAPQAFYAVDSLMTCWPETNSAGKFRLVCVPGHWSLTAAMGNITHSKSQGAEQISAIDMTFGSANVTAGKTVKLTLVVERKKADWQDRGRLHVKQPAYFP